MTAGEVVSVIVGAGAVAAVLSSAIRTVAIPRPERVWLSRFMFTGARAVSHRVANLRADPVWRNRVLGTFGPVVLLSLPAVWSVLLVGAFAAIFWGLDVGSVAQSLELSASSLTTLGFVGAPTFATRMVAAAEALLGLAIVALMISFLPTLYGTFSRREVAVGRLTTRAGEPPNPIDFVIRLQAIDRLDMVGERWSEWEDWFVELGETHTSFPALVYFRSDRIGRSWLSAAETALDTAALLTAGSMVPRTGEADTMIRSGYLALRSIADFYRVRPELEVEERESISVRREDFDALVDRLEARGVMAKVPRDEMWMNFCGWRVNYDRSIMGLRDVVGDVPTHWGSSRGVRT